MEIRIDRMPMPRVTRTDEGYLRGEAVATRTGVLIYRNADGSIRRELRHPDDVFHPDAMASLTMIPVTVDHPSVLVNADNAAALGVGATGENVRRQDGHVIVPLTITAKRGIEAVESGKQELSMGYTVQLDAVSGVYDGEEYTHRQRNIRYNHLAIVNVARAGRAARLNIDGVSVPTNVDAEEINMHKIRIDGIEYEAAPEVVNALTKANGNLATTQAKLDAAEADHAKALSTLQAKLDTAEADLKTAKDAANGEAARIDAAVTARLELLEVASQFVKADSLVGKSDRDVRVAVITSKYADFKADGRDDAYIAARFDGVVEGHTADVAKGASAALGVKRDGKDAVTETAKARNDALEAILNMHKTKED